MNKQFYLLQNPDKVKITPFADEFYDIVFILETNWGFSATPKIKNYVCYSDPDKLVCSYGGIDAYMKKIITKNLIDMKYEVFLNFLSRLYA